MLFFDIFFSQPTCEYNLVEKWKNEQRKRTNPSGSPKVKQLNNWNKEQPEYCLAWALNAIKVLRVKQSRALNVDIICMNSSSQNSFLVFCQAEIVNRDVRLIDSTMKTKGMGGLTHLNYAPWGKPWQPTHGGKKSWKVEKSKEREAREIEGK